MVLGMEANELCDLQRLRAGEKFLQGNKSGRFVEQRSGPESSEREGSEDEGDSHHLHQLSS